jgi:dCMP deaminase
MGRISKEDYYFELARVNALRATCLRRAFGAVIVKDDVPISMGYCGAPRGRKNCCDLGKCLREEQKVPSGQNYELCRSVHAEENAIINAATNGVNISGGDMYLYGRDVRTNEIFDAYACKMCKRKIINAKLKRLYAKTKTGVAVYDVSDWLAEEE